MFLYHSGRTANSVFRVWPQNEEVRFVWQAALTEAAVYLDASPQDGPVAIAGWSPDTMDPPTMALTLRRDDLSLSYFNPQEQTLILPATDPGETLRIIRPTILDLDPAWEARLSTLGAAPVPHGDFVLYTLPSPPTIQPQVPANVTFGEELRFLGHDIAGLCHLRTPSPLHPVTPSPCHLATYWQAIHTPDSPRRLFVHFLDETGNLAAEAYAFDTADPQSLWFPHWQPGDLILQRHALPPSAENVAQIRLGWFNPYTCQSGSCPSLPTNTGDTYILIEAAPTD